jgi:TPR repeat protein
LVEYIRALRKFPGRGLPDQEEDDDLFVVNNLLSVGRPQGMNPIQWMTSVYQKAAELGDPAAMCKMALMLSFSELKSDKRKAAELMKQAADRGCGRAGMYYLRMIADGNGIGNDSVDHAKYDSWENTQNRCQVVFDFATAYHQGNGVEKNIQEAIRLSELVADGGHSESCFALSEIYRAGEDGIAPNPARAILYARRNYVKGMKTEEFAERNSEKGSEREQQDDERDFLGLIQMSEFLSSGFGTIPKDAEQSTKLLAIAHMKCFAFQQYRYAQRLKSGRGVKQNETKSSDYFSLAARNGFPVGERDLPES